MQCFNEFMFSKKIFTFIVVILISLIGFSNKIFATSNNTTIEIYQDLSKPLINNNPNSLSIENNEVIIINNDVDKIKLFDLSESDSDVFITLIDNANKLFVYKNGKKVNLINSKNIDINLLINNLQASYDKEEITSLKIYGYVLSQKRVLKNYLAITENDKHLKGRIVSDNNLKLYYSASNIDGMSGFATSSTMTTSWKNLSGNNNGTLTNFALTTASGWDGNNVFSNPSRLVFDGANDYVQPTDSSPFNFNATTPLTFEFWINLATQPDNDFKYIFSRQPNFFQPGYEILLYRNTLFVKFNALSGGIPRSITLLQTPPSIGVWTHLVVSYDGSSKAQGVKIYYNGRLQSPFVSSDTLTKSDSFNSGLIRLGTTAFGVASFKGSLGDVRIYSKALSGTEVLQNYNSEVSKYYEAPSIASLSPADSSTTNIQTDLVIAFNQIISKGTGNIRITKASNGAIVETIDVTSDRVVTSGKTATINPVSNLAGDTTYTIEIDENTFKYNGVGFAGISDRNTWNFLTTNDGTPPRLTSFSPENGAQDVPVASDLVINFDENIYPGMGSINIFNEDDMLDLVEVINVNSTQVTGAGTSMITINPAMNFSPETLYLIGVDSSAFQDGAGNNYNSSRGIDRWEFLTVDTTPISVTGFSPADDATNVSVDANLQINFNKSVTVKTGNGKISIKKIADNSTVENINVNSNAVTGSGTNTIVINPVMDLAEDTRYYINIDKDAFKDIAENNYSGITDNATWNFKTADTTVPVINNLSPADDSSMINVNSDLVAVFSEPVLVKTGNITINKVTTTPEPPIEAINVTSNLVMGSGTDTITINPAMDLQEDIQYYVNIDATAFTDLSGNSFAGIANMGTWNFRTNDVTAPTVANLSPADNATEITINSNLDVTFSEIVFTKKGNINIFKSADNTLVEMIDVTSNSITGNGTNIITINPTMDFAENTNYFITIAQGTFADFYENAFTGILDNSTWNFKTVVPLNFGGNVAGGNTGGNTTSGNFGVGEFAGNNSSSSSGANNSLSSSSGNLSSSSSSGFSGSSSGLFFNPDGSLSVPVESPIKITGPNSIKLSAKKAKITISHNNVEGEIKCSVLSLGDLKTSIKPKSISFTQAKDVVNINLKINSKSVLKARKKKDKTERNLQIKVLCDDGESNLDIKILP